MEEDQSPSATCIVGDTHEKSNGRVERFSEAHGRNNGTSSIVCCRQNVRNSLPCGSWATWVANAGGLQRFRNVMCRASLLKPLMSVEFNFVFDVMGDLYKYHE